MSAPGPRRAVALVLAGGVALAEGTAPADPTPGPAGPGPGPAGPGRHGPYRVVAVVDGDTIEVDLAGTVTTVRAIGIDAPGTRDPRRPIECFGPAATTRAAELLAGRSVFLEEHPTPSDRDRYGRRRAYVWTADGRLFDEEMVASDHARHHPCVAPHQYTGTDSSPPSAPPAPGAGACGSPTRARTRPVPDRTLPSRRARPGASSTVRAVSYSAAHPPGLDDDRDEAVVVPAGPAADVHRFVRAARLAAARRGRRLVVRTQPEGPPPAVLTAAGLTPTADPGLWVGPAPALETVLVHVAARGPHGAVTPAIVPASTFAQDAPGHPGPYEYARAANPTRAALEAALAAAEGARFAHAFSSGLAALDAWVRAVPPGGTVALGADGYGGTWRLLDQVWRPWGLTVRVVDPTRPDALPAALDGVDWLLVETPSNPRLVVCDLVAVAAACASTGTRLAVDNTFATPALQSPLALGADVVVHSTTKYIAGHSDVVGGALITDDADLADRFAHVQTAVGAVPGPVECYLVWRGLRTLALRMERHCRNAAALAAALVGHPDVAAVHYPGLPDDPGHPIAAAQMRGFGGMVSFTVAHDEAYARAVCAATEVFTLAESLGGVESLICHPASMTHAAAASGPLAPDGRLVRCSIGIEAADDLVADLLGALAAARSR